MEIKSPRNLQEMCNALLKERTTLRRHIGEIERKKALQLNDPSHAAKVLGELSLDEDNSLFEDIAFPVAHRMYNAAPDVSHEQRLEHAILAALRALE